MQCVLCRRRRLPAVHHVDPVVPAGPRAARAPLCANGGPCHASAHTGRPGAAPHAVPPCERALRQARSATTGLGYGRLRLGPPQPPQAAAPARRPGARARPPACRPPPAPSPCTSAARSSQSRPAAPPPAGAPPRISDDVRLAPWQPAISLSVSHPVLPTRALAPYAP